MNIEILDRVESEKEKHYYVVFNGKLRHIVRHCVNGEYHYEEIVGINNTMASDEISEIFKAIEK